jgi:hypothetical protein
MESFRQASATDVMVGMFCMWEQLHHQVLLTTLPTLHKEFSLYPMSRHRPRRSDLDYLLLGSLYNSGPSLKKINPMHQVGSERSSSPSIIDGNIVILRHGRRCTPGRS